MIASASGRLDAWIDFNANGSWNEPGEQIFVSSLLSQGVNTLTFFVPLNAHLGATYARFRFSTSGDLRPTGLARDGEVKISRVSIIASSADLAISAIISPNPVPSLGGRCFLTVLNVGPSFAPNVVVSNRLSGVKLISATSIVGTSTIQLDPVNCEVGNMQPGETRSIIIAFRPLAQGIISDTATVRSDASDPNLSNNVATAAARAAPPLVITEPLQNQKVVLGSSATFSVEAKGVPPLSYQWFINGSGLATATGPTLTLPSVSQSATISVKVGDALGGVQTSSALLDVITPVNIIRQPNSLAHSIGSSFQLVAEADGSSPLQLQWRLNGANVRNALGPTYDIRQSTRADGGSYTLVVGNDAGLKFTETAIVTCADIPTYAGSDALSGATQLPPPGMSPFQGAVQGDTFNATRESGNPIMMADLAGLLSGISGLRQQLDWRRLIPSVAPSIRSLPSINGMPRELFLSPATTIRAVISEALFASTRRQIRPTGSSSMGSAGVAASLFSAGTWNPSQSPCQLFFRNRAASQL